MFEENNLKARRAGAVWIMKDGAKLVWNEDCECFQNFITGEAYQIIKRVSEDEVIIE